MYEDMVNFRVYLVISVQELSTLCFIHDEFFNVFELKELLNSLLKYENDVADIEECVKRDLVSIYMEKKKVSESDKHNVQDFLNTFFDTCGFDNILEEIMVYFNTHFFNKFDIFELDSLKFKEIINDDVVVFESSY